MASSFFENLWNSVFTPGPTPTLLVATNVTFGALQLVLGILLATTRSIHFVVLSSLCAGLWWAINWFAEELRKAEKAEEEAGRLRKRRSGIMEEKRDHDRESTDYAEDSTETETEVEGGAKRVPVRGGPAKAQAVLDSAAEAEAARQEHARQQAGIRIRGGPSKIQGVMKSAEDAQQARDDAAAGQGATSGVQIRGGPEKIAAVLGLRPEQYEEQSTSGADTNRRSLGEQQESGSVSTDSEWEKVSDR